MGKKEIGIAIGSALLIALGASTLFFFEMLEFTTRPFDPTSQKSIIFEVKKGMKPNDIAIALSEAGMISNARKMLWVGKLTRKWGKIKAGEYEISPRMSPSDLFGMITSGVSLIHSVTIREGENLYQVGDALEKKHLATRAEVVALCRDPLFLETFPFPEPRPHSLEGFLFPDTYFFTRGLSTREMLTQMVRKFLSVWTPERSKRGNEIGMNWLEVITLASMIEKETGASHERPIISSVFHNRLRKKMRLQSDPTTIYGLWEFYSGNITREDLRRDTPYNTYTIPALPIGPIANPGVEAIDAVLYPAETDYIFFVSKNDGTHHFSVTLAEHNQGVADYQLNKKAREGKSWRDLNRQDATQSQ